MACKVWNWLPYVINMKQCIVGRESSGIPCWPDEVILKWTWQLFLCKNVFVVCTRNLLFGAILLDLYKNLMVKQDNHYISPEMSIASLLKPQMNILLSQLTIVIHFCKDKTTIFERKITLFLLFFSNGNICYWASWSGQLRCYKWAPTTNIFNDIS